MPLAGYVLIGLLLLMIGIWAYQKSEPGRWEDDSNPDPDAEIVNISSSFRRRIFRYFFTEVTFSDGYVYETKKTKKSAYEPAIKMPMTITTQYYIDDELKQQIIEAAIVAHKKAVEEVMHNREGSIHLSPNQDEAETKCIPGRSGKSPKTVNEELLKCEICRKETDHLVPVVIIDKMGKRHRNVCDECYEKYSNSAEKN